MRASRFTAEPEPTAEALRAAPVRDEALPPAGFTLGCGGSAQVLFGFAADRRPVALKTLKPGLARDPRATLLLEHEARVLAELRHAHVVACSGLTTLPDGRPALELEYLGGGDLVSLAGAAPSLWIDSLLAVVQGVAHCHARGFTHGDLKARNVLFGGDGRPRLIDFAAARRLTAAGAEADVRALAALVYELLHAAPPPDDAAWRPLTGGPAREPGAGRLAATAEGVLGGALPARLFVLADVLEFAQRGSISARQAAPAP